MDFLGLLLMFLVFDFSFSSYIFGFNLVNVIFEYIQINDIRYPLRAIVGPLFIALIIILVNILGSIMAGIKNKKNPLFYMKGALNSYVGKIKEAKFKRKWLKIAKLNYIIFCWFPIINWWSWIVHLSYM